jgi:transposase InsO family protein
MVGRQIAARLRMPHSTVARILNRAGISRLSALDPKEPIRRYERKRAGELLHIDVKKLARIRGIGHRITGDRSTRVRGIGWDIVHVCIDDASRLAYVEVLEDEKGPTSAGFLKRALAWYRSMSVRVRRVMTDNAFTYQSAAFQSVLATFRIRHLRTRPYRPQTNGKAERFIQTMLREWAYGRPYTSSAKRSRALRPWLRHYNYNRPHGSLGGDAPISRLRGRV